MNRAALAYEVESSTLLSVTVTIRCGAGSTLTAGVDSSGYPIEMAWSADGRQLAWTDGDAMEVVKFNARKVVTSRHWTCPGSAGCDGIAFLGGRAVTATEVGPDPFPQLLVYPASESGPPTTVPMTGLPPFSSLKRIGFSFHWCHAI